MVYKLILRPYFVVLEGGGWLVMFMVVYGVDGDTLRQEVDNCKEVRFTRWVIVVYIIFFIEYFVRSM